MTGRTFDHPFSTEGCRWEEAAKVVRNFYGLPPRGPVLPDVLAACMPVEFLMPESLKQFDPGLQEELCGAHSSSWDAVTLPIPIDGRYWIIMNGTKPPTRVRITMMEELLHVHYGHTPTRLNLAYGKTLKIRTYNKAAEDEAYAVGAALLVPWRDICFDVNSGVALPLLAERHGVSEKLVRMRINTTGLTRLYNSRIKAKR
ncbi:MAG TPA: ImmA/IrrE family metallo-endopeptidase [Longimicrobium sp.]|nr:ImmA/IrrE family metallo-endopeptidase [Longimicrobium sp.]